MGFLALIGQCRKCFYVTLRRLGCVIRMLRSVSHISHLLSTCKKFRDGGDGACEQVPVMHPFFSPLNYVGTGGQME